MQQMQVNTAAMFKRHEADALADALDAFMVEYKDNDQLKAMLVHGRQMALTIRMIGRG